MSEICKQFKTRGEWDNEPDYEEWDYKGVKCHINRHNRTGHLCGYVHKGVPEKVSNALIVHGGVTWNHEDETGFDCGHCFDLSPWDFDEGHTWKDDAVYRNASYVKSQTEKLADQILFYEFEIEEIKRMQQELARALRHLEKNIQKKYEMGDNDLGLGTILHFLKKDNRKEAE